MEHEDGYCDVCGCELGAEHPRRTIVAYITRDGRVLCHECWCHALDYGETASTAVPDGR